MSYEKGYAIENMGSYCLYIVANNRKIVLRKEIVMRKKKRTVWMNLLLVFALVAGLVFPASNVSAASKQKKTTKKVLVVYFSATGTTKSAAKKVKKATGGKLYQIKAAKPYTSADLSYGNDNCRANVEQQDGTVRPKIKGKVKNIKKYDVIFLGYAGVIIGLN